MRRVAHIALILTTTVTVTACSTLAPPKTTDAAPLDQRRAATILDGARVELHVSQPLTMTSPRQPLVIFASGDGGWFGAAVGMFETIAAAGYPVAGVSSKGLLRGLRQPGHLLSASRLREAYGEIIEAARGATNSPDTGNVILAGWSRGASISVIVGAEHPKEPVAGIVAIGLAADENLNVDLESDEEGEPGSSVLNGTDTYELSRAIPGRVAVIQSSGDGYVSAARARNLFGVDSAGRRFFEVPASNHRFSGGAVAFRRALQDALDWVSSNKETLR
jgi:pimeloyl-ACP methyl ester carboxylesterase